MDYNRSGELTDPTPQALAYAQLGFAASQLMGYYGYIIVVGGSEASPIPAIGLLTPRTPPATDKSESGILAHYCGERESAEASALTRQSLLKWILTEGDKLVLLSAKRRALQHSDAGDPAAGAVVPTDNLRSMDAVYGVVFNLGSLLGRLVLEPIEIQSRAQFSKVVSFRNRHLNAPQNRAALKEYREKWTQITRAFSFRMRLLLYISLIIVCIGAFASIPLRAFESHSAYSFLTDRSTLLLVADAHPIREKVL